MKSLREIHNKWTRYAETRLGAILVMMLLIIGCLGIYQMKVSLDTTEKQNPVHDWTGFPKEMQGQAFTINPGKGFWLHNISPSTRPNEKLSQSQLEVLSYRALPLGLPVSIDLCLQTKEFKKQGVMAPVALNVTWDEIKKIQNRAAQALVVSPTIALKMPRMTMQGTYEADWWIDVDTNLIQPFPNQDQDWKMVFVNTYKNKYLSQAQNNAKQSYKFENEAWLLWDKQNDAFQYGLRMVRKRVSNPFGTDNCSGNSNGLEAQLFATDLASDQNWFVQKNANIQLENSPSSVLIGLTYLKTSEQKIYRTKLHNGHYEVPTLTETKLEFQSLFSESINKGLIRLNSAHQIEVAPQELISAFQLEQGNLRELWKTLDWQNEQVKNLHNQLYKTDNGQFVRQQIGQFNSQQMELGFRMRTWSEPLNKNDNNKNINKTSNNFYENQSANFPLTLRSPLGVVPTVNVLPANIFTWQAQFQEGWGPWVKPQLQVDRLNNSIQLNQLTSENWQLVWDWSKIHLPDDVAGIELLIAAEVLNIQGATQISQKNACDGSTCPSSNSLVQLRIAKSANDSVVTINFKPLLNVKNNLWQNNNWSFISIHNAQLKWTNPPAGVPYKKQLTPALNIFTADGKPLVLNSEIQDNVLNLGLQYLIKPAAHNGLIQDLMHQGVSTKPQINAQLTIDSKWQKLGQKVLECVGQKQGRWISNDALTAQENCEASKLPPDGRRSTMLWMNADNGDILVAASAPTLDSITEEAYWFDKYQPGKSQLQNNLWRLDGSNKNVVGSTGKLIDALALESWAKNDKARQALLEGQTPAQLNALARLDNLNFVAESDCYPATCKPSQSNKNFGNAPLTRYLHNQQFGLVQAIQNSVNTWFIWTQERIDDRLKNKRVSISALNRTALDESSQLLSVAHQLGFDQALRLDGGLYPKDFLWKADSPLQASPSTYSQVWDEQALRQQFVGQRVQVTALQMALVSSAIATGEMKQPRLLSSLNDRRAQESAAFALNIPLQRIRMGMSKVVTDGTAKQAFAGEDLNQIRTGIFGKTGTATLSKEEGNMVWFVGYVKAGTLPNQKNNLAFVVSVTHSDATAGAHAALVISDFLKAVQKVK